MPKRSQMRNGQSARETAGRQSVSQIDKLVRKKIRFSKSTFSVSSFVYRSVYMQGYLYVFFLLVCLFVFLPAIYLSPLLFYKERKKILNQQSSDCKDTAVTSESSLEKQLTRISLLVGHITNPKKQTVSYHARQVEDHIVDQSARQLGKWINKQKAVELVGVESCAAIEVSFEYVYTGCSSFVRQAGMR